MGSRAVTFLCFARGAVDGVSHPLAGVGFGDRDRGGAVEVKSEARVVLSEVSEIVGDIEGHAGWDNEEVERMALLLADVGLGGSVDLGGDGEDEAEAYEFVRVRGRPGADVDDRVPLDLLVEVLGEGGLYVYGEVLRGGVVGGDDVLALNGAVLDVLPRVLGDDVHELDVERVVAEAEGGRVEGLSVAVLVLDDAPFVLFVVIGLELAGVDDRLIGSGGRVELYFRSLWFAG